MWAYAGERRRAAPFAVAAVKHAEATGDPRVLAEALDAALATHWGPDELEVRVDLAGRLDDTTAHLTDAGARTKAHLWLLTVALDLYLAGAPILGHVRGSRPGHKMNNQLLHALFERPGAWRSVTLTDQHLAAAARRAATPPALHLAAGD